MTKQVFRVLLADDHTILREGLRALLDSSPDIMVIGEAADGHEEPGLHDGVVEDVQEARRQAHGRVVSE